VSPPLVIKFGGDALATAERIALAAERVRQRLEHSPVVAVASARRGVTDHLLGLVEQVKEVTAAVGRETHRLAAAADRAVAAGELVSASLLAVALNRVGIPSEVLDAREAGLTSNGDWSRAELTRIRPERITRLLRRGITPVITGFQGWHRGRVTTLGRGGSDTTAVAIAAELEAVECELVKHSGGIYTADPKVVPGARLIPHASHRFLLLLAEAGARVMALRAAALADLTGLPLRFSSLEGDSASLVRSDGPEDVSALAWRTQRQFQLTLIGPGWSPLAERIARGSDARLFRSEPGVISFEVPDAGGISLVRALHEVLFNPAAHSSESFSHFHSQLDGRRAYVGH
jgi:aspartate kinase